MSNSSLPSSMRLTAFSAAFALSLAGCKSLTNDGQVGGPAASEATVDSVAVTTSPTFAFIDSANMDLSVNACHDFFLHANGGWLKSTMIPADQSAWGSFNILQETVTERLRAILDAGVANPNARGIDRQVADFYAAGMDEIGIESLGAKPIEARIAEIAALKNHRQLVAHLRARHATGQGGLFGFGAGPDFKDSSIQIAYARQGGLGLPERDYYLRSDAASQNLLANYQQHIANSFVLLGHSAGMANEMAKDVIGFETRLAKASLTRVEQRDPKNRYRLLSVLDANKETPNFNWNAYFAALGIQVERFSLSSPLFFAEVNAMLIDVPVSSWQNYLRWDVVRNASPYLSKAFVDENFDFYSKQLSGTAEQRPRWKRMVQLTSGSLGQPLGQLYVEQHFSAESKAQALRLIDDLRAALKIRLENLPWMSELTKRQALQKLSTFTPKIGYPDQWRDYSSLSFERTDLVGNLRKLSEFESRYDLNRIGKPTDRSEWRMSPQTVNASYNSQNNEITFPAAILQFPFFDPKADPAINYGGIGGVIGHEFLHGFDDQGSKFDATGAHRDWWSAEDRSLFEARIESLQAHASATKVGDGQINGKLTLGENIADLGGTQVAFDALQMAQARNPVAEIDGYTQNQRFFLSWAQIWRRAMRPEALKLMLNTDPHSPSVYRVNGPLSNSPTFAQAFDCKPGDAMVNPNRVEIW